MVQLFWHGDSAVPKQLTRIKYAKLMAQQAGICSGQNEENVDELHNILFNISNFFAILHQGRDDGNNPRYEPLPKLRRLSEEEFEQEGGIEEIESFFMNKGKASNGNKIADSYKMAQGCLLNCFQHKTNDLNRDNDDVQEDQNNNNNNVGLDDDDSSDIDDKDIDFFGDDEDTSLDENEKEYIKQETERMTKLFMKNADSDAELGKILGFDKIKKNKEQLNKQKSNKRKKSNKKQSEQKIINMDNQSDISSEDDSGQFKSMSKSQRKRMRRKRAKKAKQNQIDGLIGVDQNEEIEFEAEKRQKVKEYIENMQKQIAQQFPLISQYKPPSSQSSISQEKQYSKKKKK
ncbi:MAG: hypothetical protein EZS28_030001 [Streblomastix strix]|uniref:Uncharacterized protein n=1 Tax=Streblomastix strix TaxID=222440 RepID=A0A5J4UWL5_9EUKA|nr:MAG: hypothetical protein EZS28_030001 [Streblomastix strix]